MWGTKCRKETAIPFQAFKDAGFLIYFATQHGKAPQADEKMLKGITQKILVSPITRLDLLLSPVLYYKTNVSLGPFLLQMNKTILPIVIANAKAF